MNTFFGRFLRARFRIVLIAFSAVLALTGCTTARMYRGPAKSQDQVAVLFRQANLVKVESLDGQSIPLLKRAKTLELLPGPHTIECSFRLEYMGAGYASATSTNGLIHLSFDAKAGYTYWIDSNVNPFKEEWHPEIKSAPTKNQEPTK
jgi:hypothetical protein